MDTQSTADRLQMMKKNMEMMHSQRLARIENMQALYAALDASQQAIFDKALKHSHHWSVKTEKKHPSVLFFVGKAVHRIVITDYLSTGIANFQKLLSVTA